MADLRDFTGKNRRFTGTDSISISSGTTAQRVNTTGVLRFKWKRNSVHTDTTATIVETQSGIYNTFNVQTREKLNTNPNSGA